MRRLPLILAALLLAFTAAPAPARVWESLGRSASSPGGSHPGWIRAYAASWTLNGAPADVEVWSASEPLPAALARMRAEAGRKGDMAVFFPGRDMAWGAIAAGNRIARALCSTSESGRRTTVFLFWQSGADFRRAAPGPEAARLPDSIPEPPGARPVFTAASEESGSTIAIFSASGAAEEIRAFMAASLAGAGWTSAAGPNAGFAAGSLGFYVRPGALCAVSAKMSRHDGSCVVTVLHRRLKEGE